VEVGWTRLGSGGVGASHVVLEIVDSDVDLVVLVRRMFNVFKAICWTMWHMSRSLT